MTPRPPSLLRELDAAVERRWPRAFRLSLNCVPQDKMPLVNRILIGYMWACCAALVILGVVLLVVIRAWTVGGLFLGVAIVGAVFAQVLRRRNIAWTRRHPQDAPRW
jgi:hypothetical protein